ncbi:MAG: glutathione S-transferase family protein [Rhizobacter sp.]|nr:glutathione S-transferase family protein [Rhizobacter sp.]
MLTLYYHPLASFCHKVLIALYDAGTDFERRIIDLADEAERAELQALWPVGKFPVIRDSVRGRSVPESTVIIEYLDHHYPGAQPLIPHDWDAALEVRLWDRFFDSYVQTPMQQIVADRLRNAGGNLSEQRATLTTAWGMLERHLASGSPWISTAGFSLADCSAAPALFYARTLVPFPPDAPQVAAYFERLIARPSVQRVLDEARPYLQYYPFAEAVEARFR